MEKKIPFRLYVFLALVALCAFLPVLRAELLNWDDHTHVYRNEAVLSFDLQRIFTETVNETYIPLTSLSFAVEKAFFGVSPFIFHLDNLLLHILAACLLMAFFVEIGAPLRAAFLGALLFAVHPMRVESVAWVTERKDMLYAVFYVLALRQWWRFLEDRRAKGFWMTLVWSGSSLLAKPMAVSLPLVMLLFEWWRGGDVRRIRWMTYVPVVLITAAIGWMTYSHHVRNPVGDIGVSALIWVWSLGFYVWKFFFPVMLYPVYELPTPVGIGHPVYFMSLAIVLAAVAAVWVAARKHLDRWLLLAAGFFFLSIFFLLRLDAHDAHLVAERFMYLPCAGICLWLGIKADTALERYGRPAMMVIVGILALLGARTFSYTFVWKDSVTLWSYVIRHYPHKELAYNNRAVAYGETGRYDLAIQDHSTVLTFPSNRALAFFNRGINFRDWGQQKMRAGLRVQADEMYRRALADFNEAIRLDPDYIRTYALRARVRYYLGDESGALADLDMAIAREPGHADDHLNRGNVLAARGDLDGALGDYRRAIELGLKGPGVHNNVGIIYARKGMDDLALQYFEAALRVDPRHGDAYFNRSVVLRGKGDLKGALADALHARSLGVAVDPAYLQSLENRN